MRTLALFLLLIPLADAQTASIQLEEANAPGTLLQATLDMKLSGRMNLDRNGSVEAVPLEATGKHAYTERIDGTAKALRLYAEASSTTVAGVDRGTRTLSKERRLIVAQRNLNSLCPWSPAGPLTQDDLSLVAEHFDTLSLPGLLPNKAVAVNDTWPIQDATVGALCSFDGIIKHSLAGKMTELGEKSAIFTVEGTAEGVENGAKVKLTVTAKGTFDIVAKRIVSLTWEQTDDREAGPISPAMEAKVTVTVTRNTVAESPAEFAVKLPEIATADLLGVLYRQPNGAFELAYDRNWHPVVQTESHLVLRLVTNSELIAQATIAPWKKADPAVPADELHKEFIDATAKQPGWVPEKVLASAAGTGNATAKLFSHTVLGKQDGLPVQQSFYVLTAADGRRVILSVTVRVEQAETLGTQDATLANAILFPAPK
ncbi:hypothetical protein BH11PLA2_BH11PLA2_44090 [soil metagenome]